MPNKTKQGIINAVFHDIDKLPLGIAQHTFGLDHYDRCGNEIMVHQPDCIRCKYIRVKKKWGAPC